MLRTSGFAILALVLPLASPCWSQELETCTSVHFAETGWTDLALTTETARHVLTALGYETKSDMLGLGIIYESLESGSIDAFLGYWPLAQVEFQPYYDRNAAIVLGDNLENTKFTLAVPTYVAEAGVKSFDDLAAHAEKFDSKIYGIEPGSNGYILDMVAAGGHGTQGWEVVESSEQGMLAQVESAIDQKDWIVFLGWAPHPMNTRFDMTYLSGGDDVFGPNYGSDTVRTVARPNFDSDCPNASKLLANIKFTMDYENAGMARILNDEIPASDAALEMMRKNPDLVYSWLDGVTTRDGQPARAAVETLLK